ncbi:MAG TPA: SIMPL domain-containing protein [Gammaproteobacteria bacterium]|nr:SIMPL domain-containing protein [Gammaproteobacteria bacterium]
MSEPNVPGRRWMSRLAACAALAFAGLAAAQPPNGPRPRDPRPTVAVSGTGQVAAAPDRAVVRLGAVAEAEDAKDAQSRLNAVMQKVLAAIEKLGVPKSAIRTEGLSLSPVYTNAVSPGNREPQAPRISGYRAANVVSVQLDDLTRIGPAVDAGITAGANELQGVAFDLKDSSAARNAALTAAVNDARAQAETIASALGMRLDGLESLVTNASFSGPPQPFAMARRAALDASTPVQPGELEVASNVTATYYLAPR